MSVDSIDLNSIYIIYKYIVDGQARCRNVRLLNYIAKCKYFKNNFVLWSAVTFSLPVKQQTVWKCQTAETLIYSFRKKMRN